MTEHRRSSENGATEDRRVRRTRTRLTEALLELMKSKPVDRITVTELTERADVNRVTFYSHYGNVRALLDTVMDEVTVSCRSRIETHADQIIAGDFLPLATDILTYVDEHEQVFSVMVSSAGEVLFNRLADDIRDVCNRVVDPVSQAVESTGERLGDAELRRAEMIRDYQFDYIMGGIMNVVRNWFAGGRREPIEFVAAILASTTRAAGPESLRRNLSLAQKGPEEGETAGKNRRTAK
ncbi:TetR/AcrR family transcriptional regulator [Bifidobacterium callimiconis]|uniref:TetR family transcriptional regulator n=1 Tax=Bifidobacterium callimiconis TaxID=2306973 RepID=A0A430F9H2_9BIFI|nr:TetR/AcrR family transcriptional regulator [Bifidobacterium callimiconis]RSX49484.1 TetR family transcriptional regulator [Bifidobacterium callimiconis]